MNHLTSLIQQEADHCVKCGLCLPHCPTYAKTSNEADSPRGRIALMQGLVSGQLNSSERLIHHLDGCLACRACENVCPSKVRYGLLIDSAQTILEQQRNRNLPQRLGFNLVKRKPLLATTARLLRLYQKSGLRWLARHSQMTRLLGLKQADELLPRIPAQNNWRAFYPARGHQAGSVSLFTGCIDDVVNKPLIKSAIDLLTRCGYGVHVPQEQVCCGALHLHNGMPDEAGELARQNISVFNKLNVDAVVFISSGCGAVLSEYEQLDKLIEHSQSINKNPSNQSSPSPIGAEDRLQRESSGQIKSMDTRISLHPIPMGSEHGDIKQSPSVPKFKTPVMDINRFISQIDCPGDSSFKPLNKHVVIHDPCSLTNVLHDQAYPYRLLEKIPGLKITPLPDNNRCCGAAGSHMLTQPQMAKSLREDKLEHLKRLQPDILLTSNVGCALHLSAGIRQAKLDIQILHPVELLVQQIQVTSDK